MLRILCGAALSGAITSLAFDPFTWWPAAIVGVAGLFLLVHRTVTDSWRHTAVAGFWYGLGFLAPLIWWMNAVSIGAYVALVVVEAMIFAVVALALRSAARLP